MSKTKRELEKTAFADNIFDGAQDIPDDIAEVATPLRLNPNFDAFLSKAPSAIKDDEGNSVITEGRVFEVEVDKLHDEPNMVRSVYPEQRVQEMLDTLLSDGQQTPILVYPHDTLEGHFYLRAGGTRTRAARLGKLPTLKALLVAKADSKKETYSKSRATNIQNKTDPVSNGLAWKKLLDEGEFMTQDELASFYKVDPGEVSRCIRLTDLPSDLIEMCLASEEHSNTRFMKAVQNLYEGPMNKDKVKTMAFVQQHIANGKGARQLEAEIKSMGRAPVIKHRADESWDFELGSAKGKFRSVYSTGTVEFSVQGATEEQLALIKEFVTESFPPTKIKIASAR